MLLVNAKSSLAALALVGLAASKATRKPLVINTPSDAVECQPTLLTWSGGDAPYFLSVQPGGDPVDPPIESLGEQSGMSFTWVTDVTSGTSVSLELRDSKGTIALSAPFTIESGSSGCIASGSSLVINTPAEAEECEPTLISWSGGEAPYFLSVQPGDDPSGGSLENLGQQNGMSYTWDTDIAAGTSVSLEIRDSTGVLAQSAPFTVNTGSTGCIQ